MRFLWHTIFAASANLLLISSVFYFLFSGPSELPVLEEGPDKETLFTQERLFLTKDLLYVNPEGERMQMRVRGKKASLIIATDGKGHQIKEQMSGVKGYSNGCFDAESAEFDNQTGQVFASGVKFFKLVLPGQRMAEGTCERLRFSLKGREINVVAEGFHGQFQGGKDL